MRPEEKGGLKTNPPFVCGKPFLPAGNKDILLTGVRRQARDFRLVLQEEMMWIDVLIISGTLIGVMASMFMAGRAYEREHSQLANRVDKPPCHH